MTFNRFDVRVKTLIGFLQYTLHSGNVSTIHPKFVLFWWGIRGLLCTNPCRCGENVGKFAKRKIAKPLVFKGLAITFELNSYPEPGSNRHGLPHWCLRPARLPIPPSGLEKRCKGTKIFLFTNGTT